MAPDSKEAPRGASVRIFLADGTPNGLRVVEKSNWTGRAVMCSRSQYPKVRNRQEFTGTGVYALLGPSDDRAYQEDVYVGEGDEARSRLDNHLRNKDFWNRLILFGSKDRNLNKAHVQYLESRLVELALSAKRARVLNGNQPQSPNLSEADLADAGSFLEDMLLIYPLLGVTCFQVAKGVNSEGGERTESPELFIKAKGVVARGKDTSEGFIVFEGSQAVVDTTPSIHEWLVAIREDLQKEGVLAREGEFYRFTQDFSFNSPSAAAGVVQGRSANGRKNWKTEDGRTLKEIQEEGVPPGEGDE